MKVRIVLPFAGRIVCWMSEQDAVKLWALGPHAERRQYGKMTETVQALIVAAERGLVNYYRRAHTHTHTKTKGKVSTKRKAVKR